MARYRAIYDSRGLLYEIENDEVVFMRDDYGQETESGPQVIRDIEPYKSMVDGSMITSRSHHREHLKRHNCFEVGNEKIESRPVAPPSSMDRRIALHRQLGDMSDRQANKILAQLRR